MHTDHIQLLLADDDEDDRMLFHEALKELPVSAELQTARDGEQLMDMLLGKSAHPDILFLDLNMPRKTGIDCLSEIRQHDLLKALPVIIYSTSFIPEVVNQLYEDGATHYIRKPGEFAKLKKAILEAITSASPANLKPTAKENFVIQV